MSEAGEATRTAATPAPVFTPRGEDVERSQMTAFARFLAERTGRRFDDPAALHRFSVAEVSTFWRAFLDWSGLEVSGEAEPACTGSDVERATFFPGLEVSYVQNLLGGRHDASRPAVFARDETGRRVQLSRGELAARVLRAATSLRRLGVAAGDRVVAVARNTEESVVACLASLALGAVWSATSPDLGLHAILDRFGQLSPKVLFFHPGYRIHGAERDLRGRVTELLDAIPTLESVIALSGAPLDAPAARPIRTSSLDALVADGGDPITLETLPRFPWNHPLFVLFSSGTTGPPKCIVHGAGGTLIEHHKEHRLHGDLGPTDTLYFQTSCGWMMWNWQLTALACGTQLGLYDGSVSFPEPDSLWKLVEAERVTVLGTSPAYLQYCQEAGIVPRESADLGALRAIQSTGSVLADRHYGWVKDSVKELPLQSVSGGTDIVGCFLLGHPNLPVYAGEMQCVGLGLDVRARRIDGTMAAAHEGAATGELVCATPFPSRPIGLFGDPEGKRFHDAYFSQNPGLWTHGDILELTDRGTARVHGRSDGVLNVRGIRIGPAEIYGALAAVPEISESMALEQATPSEPGGSRLVLLVVLRAGATLDRALTLRIKKELSQRCSAAHVPSAVAQVAELPTTHSGKRSERAARDALHGREVANRAALRNPECLAQIATHPALVAP